MDKKELNTQEAAVNTGIVDNVDAENSVGKNGSCRNRYGCGRR